MLARVLSPVIWLLVKLRVPPNAVSLSQIPVGIIAAAFAAEAPRASFVLFIFAVVIDVIDGALARRLGKESNHGALVDQVSDHAREIAMIAALAYSGALNGGLAAAYAFSHPLSNFMLYLGSARLVRAPFAVKTWMSFYPFLFLYLWFEINYLNVAAAISASAMVTVSFWLLWSLRNRM